MKITIGNNFLRKRYGKTVEVYSVSDNFERISFLHQPTTWAEISQSNSAYYGSENKWEITLHRSHFEEPGSSPSKHRITYVPLSEKTAKEIWGKVEALKKLKK